MKCFAGKLAGIRYEKAPENNLIKHRARVRQDARMLQGRGVRSNREADNHAG